MHILSFYKQTMYNLRNYLYSQILETVAFWYFFYHFKKGKLHISRQKNWLMLTKM